MPDFQNPQQQDPGAQKRLLIAFALTFVVIMLMQPLLKKYGPQQAPAKPAEQQQTQPEPAPSQTPAAAAVAATSGAAVAQPAPKAEAKQASAETETVIENDLFKITFINRGAQVKSWLLKKYQDQPHGKPLELINSAAASKFGYPLSLWTYDAGLREKLSSALYVSDQSGTVNAPGSVTFEYSDGDLVVRKKFTFDHSYVVRVEAQVTQGGQPVRAFPAWPAGFGDTANLPGYAAQKIEYQAGDKIERIEPKKVSGGATLHGPFHWAGATDQYFAAVFLPDEPEAADLVTLHNEVEIPKNPDKPSATDLQKVPVLGVALGNIRGNVRQRIFVGPKALDALDSVHSSLTKSEATALGINPNDPMHRGPDLTGLVDFGRYFGFIAKPLFLWLKWTHDHWVANWGWSILILTVIITVATLPLRISGMKSMMKMAKIQPEMKSIQDKYRKYKFNDPRKADMQKEINELYKREGASPVGGCLPTVIQLPFLIAFYSMLGVGIELRHAPWLWIKDLSSPDPLYLLPILITISMFVVQKMTPQAGMDPAQAKMMAFMMPLFIGYISLNLASGLGIYWAASNLLQMAQQTVLNRTEFGRQMREAQLKRAGKK